MKPIKFLFISLALPLLCGTAQTQTTPDTVIGRCPALPSMQTLVAAERSDEPAREAVYNFEQQIAGLRDIIDKGKKTDSERRNAVADKDRAKLRNDANQQAKAQYDKSVDELQNMSEAEQEAFARSQADKRIAESMGGMNLADLQQLEGKSDEDIITVTSGILQQYSGLTFEEMQAIANMTEAQAEAYLKEDGRMQCMEAAYKANKPAFDRQQAAGEAAMREQEHKKALQKKQNRLLQPHLNLERQLNNEKTKIATQIQQIWDSRYAARYKALWEKYNSCFDGKTALSPETCREGSRQIDALYKAFGNEAYGLWRPYIENAQKRIKALMPGARQIDEEMEPEMLKSIGAVHAAQVKTKTAQWDIAKWYLDISAAVTNYPSVEANNH